MADLLDRLSGNVDISDPDPQQQKIAVHQFYAALIAFADGKLTRGQIEAGFDIQTTGAQSTDLDFIVNSYTGITGSTAASEFRRVKYLDRLHTIFMLAEHEGFGSTFTKGEIATWLTEAADGTI